MVFSYLLYIGLLILCWLLALLADKKQDVKCVWAIIAALTVIAGFRHASVGVDTASYLLKFGFISHGLPQYAYGLESTFKAICSTVLNLFPDTTVLLLIFAFITNALIISRLWELRNIASFSTSVACYYMAFFFLSLNVMRQFVAIAILFYSTKYLIRHQTVRYICMVLVATLFHKSSLLGIVLLAFDFFRWKELREWYKLVLVGAVCLSPFIFLLGVQYLGRYEKYLNEIEINWGIVVPIKIVFFLCGLLFVYCLYGKNNHFPDWTGLSLTERNSLYLSCFCYGLGLILMFGSYILPIMNRVGWYFSVHECLFMGMMTKTKNTVHRYIFAVCVLLLAGLGFVTAMTGNHQNTMPYLFFWQ